MGIIMKGITMRAKIAAAIVLLFVAGSLLLTSNGSEGAELRMRTDLGRSHASFWGEDADDQSGYSVAGVGDVNGDGYDDILIGAYADDDGGSVAGQTYLILGKASGWAMDTDLSAASASFWGEDANDFSGTSVAGAGDVNGDGYDDILIGAWGDEDGGSQAGQIYLILGKASGWAMDTDLSSASASFWGEDAGDFSGDSVAGAGDVNGDGYDDILIGAWGDDDGGTNAGQTYLIFGKASGWAMDMDLSSASASFWGEDAGDYSGDSVAGAGDVNGDGYDDILIGAWGDDDGGTNAGQTYLIFGMASGWAMDTDLSAASASFWGEGADDQSGFSVAGAGDVNGDGYDDILIGAEGDDDGGSGAGQTYLILGKVFGWARDTDLSNADASFWGEKSSDHSGWPVAVAGDVNRDGYDDTLIGAYGNRDGGGGAGQTYLILGKASGWAMDTDLSTASASFRGEDDSDLSGWSVAGAGDVNGDSYDDILIGAFSDEDGGANSGQTYLILSGVDPPGPRNLRYSLSSSLTRVTLNWDAPNSWAEPLEAYRIYRSANGMDYQYLGFTSTSTRTYADPAVTIGVTYHYMVVADYDGGWENSGKAYLSVVCDRDTNGDGIGNLADIDDDGDGYPDHSDGFPLDKTEWLDSDLDGEGNEADKDDDNDGIPDDDDDEPLNPINGIMTDLAALSSDLHTVRSEICGYFDLMNSSIENVNDTILERMDEMDREISAYLYQLERMMDSLNISIHIRLDSIDNDLAVLRGDLQSGMDAISVSLDNDQAQLLDVIGDLREEVSSLSVSLAGMNGSVLNKIDEGLRQLSYELGSSEDSVTSLIDEMRAKLTLYRTETKDEIENVSALMARMQELKALSDSADRIEDDLDTLNDLQTGVGDIKKEQEDTNKGLSTNTVLMIIVMVLLIIAIAMLSVVLIRGRRHRHLSME
jgi:hypothetical protein